MSESYETSLVPSRGNRYDDDLRQLVYEIWLLRADRNATRAHQMLSQMIREQADTGEYEIDEESLPIPTVRQVQKWAKEGNWAKKAAEDVASIAPHLYKDGLARLFAQLEAAQRFDGDMLAGVYDHFPSPGVLAIKEKVAARVQTLIGMGTAAGLSPTAMPSPTVSALPDDASPQERARWMREKLDERREKR